jgi:hypothetical protein
MNPSPFEQLGSACYRMFGADRQKAGFRDGADSGNVCSARGIRSSSKALAVMIAVCSDEHGVLGWLGGRLIKNR